MRLLVLALALASCSTARPQRPPIGPVYVGFCTAWVEDGRVKSAGEHCFYDDEAVFGASANVTSLVSDHNTDVCAIMDGDVRCWGDAITYQFGVPHACPYHGDVPSTVIREVVALAVYDGLFCALTAGREVLCWGRGHHDYTAFEVERTHGYMCEATPVPFAFGSPNILAHGRHLCAGANHTLACLHGGRERTYRSPHRIDWIHALDQAVCVGHERDGGHDIVCIDMETREVLTTDRLLGSHLTFEQACGLDYARTEEGLTCLSCKVTSTEHSDCR